MLFKTEKITRECLEYGVSTYNVYVIDYYIFVNKTYALFGLVLLAPNKFNNKVISQNKT